MVIFLPKISYIHRIYIWFWPTLITRRGFYCQSQNPGLIVNHKTQVCLSITKRRYNVSVCRAAQRLPHKMTQYKKSIRAVLCAYGVRTEVACLRMYSQRLPSFALTKKGCLICIHKKRLPSYALTNRGCLPTYVITSLNSKLQACITYHGHRHMHMHMHMHRHRQPKAHKQTRPHKHAEEATYTHVLTQTQAWAQTGTDITCSHRHNHRHRHTHLLLLRELLGQVLCSHVCCFCFAVCVCCLGLCICQTLLPIANGQNTDDGKSVCVPEKSR